MVPKTIAPRLSAAAPADPPCYAVGRKRHTAGQAVPNLADSVRASGPRDLLAGPERLEEQGVVVFLSHSTGDSRISRGDMPKTALAMEFPPSRVQRPPDCHALLSDDYRDRLVANGIQDDSHQIGQRMSQLQGLQLFSDRRSGRL